MSSELNALESELREALAPALQLLEPIGSGGMGSVYRARDPALRRDVAVKVLSPHIASQPEARERFEREAAAAATVRHQGIVAVHQVGRLDRAGTSYFVMELIEGRTVESLLEGGEPLAGPTARRIVGELAAALAAAHARGRVHRDVKPANVIIEAETGRTVLVDFGISATSRPVEGELRLTAEGMSLGTPAYMSPEQAAGEPVGQQSDVYNLGLVAFELLTGRHPFADERTAMAMRAAHINRAAPRLSDLRPDVEPALVDLVARCLAKDATQRPDARAIATQLGVVEHELIEWPPPGTDQLVRRARTMRRSIGIVAAAAVAFLLVQVAPPRGAAVDPSFGAWWWSLLENPEIVWLVAIGLTLFVWLLFIAVAVFATGAWFSAVLRARAFRYPWSTLFSVSLEAATNGSALRNRLGRFAMLDADRVAALERRRVAAGAARALAFGIVAALPIVVPYPLGAGSVVTGPLLESGRLMVILSPSLALLALAWYFQWQETRLAEGRHRSRFAPLPIPPEAVVLGWLKRRGLQPSAAQFRKNDRVRDRAVVWASVAAGFAGMWLLLQVAMVTISVSFNSSSHAMATQKNLQAWMSDPGHSTRLASAEAAFGAMARPPVAGRPVDIDALRLLLRQKPDETPLGDTGTVLIQRIALSGQPNPHWFARYALADSRRPRQVFGPTSLGALFGSRVDVRRATENWRPDDFRATASALFTAADRLGNSWTAANVRARFRGRGATLLEDLATATGDPRAQLDADRLFAALRTIRSERRIRWQSLLAIHADPAKLSDPLPRSFAAVAPSNDERALATIWGACANPREVFFGIEPRRRAAVEQLAATASDADERTLIRRWLVELDRLESDAQSSILTQWEFPTWMSTAWTPQWSALGRASERESACAIALLFQ